MVDYLPNQIVDMIHILGEAGSNYSAAKRLYAESYPKRRHPCRKTIKFIERAQQSSFKKIRKKSEPNAANSLVGCTVLNPYISIGQIERQHSISKSTANRILKINRFHRYHIHLIHHLEPKDFKRRLQFCNWALNQIQRNPHFIAKNMKERIQEACTNINTDVLQKVRDDFCRRLDVYIQINDDLLEHRQ